MEHPLVLAVIGLAAFLGAVGALLRMFGIPALVKGTRLFLMDWNGEAARPGFLGRKSFPERMTDLEGRTEVVEEATTQLKRNGGTSVADAIHRTERAVTDVKTGLSNNADAINRMEDRVTDHRRRNEEQAVALRAELERRADKLEQTLIARNAVVDSKLDTLAEDVFRAQAARAILTELNMKIDPDDIPLVGGGGA